MKVDSWQHKIEMEQNKMKIEQQKIRLELQKGVWCGYKKTLSKKANSKIQYDKLLHSSTNMENPGIGLDTQSGTVVCINHVITSCNKCPKECSQSL